MSHNKNTFKKESVMMGIWTIPAIIASILIIAYSVYSTVSVMRMNEQRASSMDTPIPKAIKEHPMLLNPIIIMYFIFLLFTGIIIFYYWSIY